MCLFHMAFVVTTFLTADLTMTLPLYRAEYGRPTNNESIWIVPTTFVEDEHMLYIAWVALAFSALSAAFHFANAQLWRSWYLASIADARCPPRWIEYSLSAPLQGVAIAYFTGNMATDNIVSVFGFISSTMFFGHLTEVIARPAGPAEWTRGPFDRLQAHFLGYVPFVFGVALILESFASASSRTFVSNTTGVPVERSMPDFVYIIVISQLLLFSSFTVVQLIVTLSQPKFYVYGELAYMILSLVAKGVLSLLLLANVIAVDAFA